MSGVKHQLAEVVGESSLVRLETLLAAILAAVVNIDTH